MSFHLPMESPIKPPFLIHAVGEVGLLGDAMRE